MLTVQAYDWSLEEKENDAQVQILAWCLKEDSSPCLVRIPYSYTCYLELTSLTSYGGKAEKLTEERMKQLLAKIRNDFRDYFLVSLEVTQKEKLYYYSGSRKKVMLKVVFTCLKGVQEVQKKYKKGIRFVCSENHRFQNYTVTVLLHEEKHSPIRRLLTERECSYASWFTIAVSPVPEAEKLSIIEEFMGSSSTLMTLPEKKEVTHPKIFSYDIECYSNNHRAMPKEFIPEHVVYMISAIIFRTGLAEREKYLIVISDNPQARLEIAGTTVISVDNEVQLCQAFAQLIIESNPDILTGYNIFGFDYPYLYARLGLYNLSWPNIGRMRQANTELIEINWKSAAYSRQKYYMMSVKGRVNFDLYTLVRREMKLLRYNLDTVAKENLGRGKHDVSPVEMFTIYENYMADPLKYRPDLQRVAEYCIEDAALVVELFEKLSIWIWLTEFSSVTGVSVGDLFIRGQQVRCYSLLQDRVIREGMVMDKISLTRETYQGAFVSDPVPGLYEYAVCLDFNSLYPNIMREYNMCYTTLVNPQELSTPGLFKEEDLHVLKWSEVDEKGQDRDFCHVFVKEHVRPGILPQILTGLIDKRKAVRASMRGDNDPISLNVKDKQQLAFKVVANSLYGFTGARQGFLPIPQIAASVTAMGRYHIQQCNEYLAGRYNYQIIYNDTDSVFFALPANSYLEALQRGKELEKEVSDFFPKYLNLEMEKVGRMFCIKKKMYAFWGVDGQGQFLPVSKIMHKGIVLNRRDNCKWQRDFYEQVLMDCLERKSMIEMRDKISQLVINLFTRQQSWQDFVIVKSVGEEYKSNSHAMSLFKENMALRGTPVNAGDRVDYVITDKKAGYLGQKMSSPEHFHDEESSIDYSYYLEHFGTKNIEKLFNIAHGQEVQAAMTQARKGQEERAAYKALQIFLHLYPECTALFEYSRKRLSEEEKSYHQLLHNLHRELERQRIGKRRHELMRFYKHYLPLYPTNITEKLVKQQYSLVCLKRIWIKDISENHYRRFYQRCLAHLHYIFSQK